MVAMKKASVPHANRCNAREGIRCEIPIVATVMCQASCACFQFSRPAAWAVRRTLQGIWEVSLRIGEHGENGRSRLLTRSNNTRVVLAFLQSLLLLNRYSPFRVTCMARTGLWACHGEGIGN